jgi:hypothetical protein
MVGKELTTLPNRGCLPQFVPRVGDCDPPANITPACNGSGFFVVPSERLRFLAADDVKQPGVARQQVPSGHGWDKAASASTSPASSSHPAQAGHQIDLSGDRHVRCPSPLPSHPDAASYMIGAQFVEAVMPGTFGFDDGVQGLFVVVEREPLSAGCSSPEEIDSNILRLQADLDRVGAEMKRALSVRDPAIFSQRT